MSPYPSQNHPWPVQTPAPPLDPPPSRSKRKRDQDDFEMLTVTSTSTSLQRRQTSDADEVAQAQAQCWSNSGNNVISCFPTSGTVVLQNQWAAFVWNSRIPQITQFNLVDIYLFHADSRQQVLYFPNQPNPTNRAGIISAQVNDTWWGNRGQEWNGTNMSYTFYWVLVSTNDTHDLPYEIPQSTFTALQTTYANSVMSSMSSSSSAAAAAASSSEMSRSLGSRPTASVQSNVSSNPFPHWAIAVIAVLAFLAFTAFLMVISILLLQVRRRRHAANRRSTGSDSPMMANVDAGPQSSPVLQAATMTATTTPMKKQSSSMGHRPPSLGEPTDGASTISGEGGLFSGADAAIMADAFRKALRKPDFAGQPAVEEGDRDSADKDEELIEKELAEEGRGLRSVSSSREVRVEKLGGDGGSSSQH